MVTSQGKQRKRLGMKYIDLPFNEIRRLPFYLAMEEYLVESGREGDCFFMWRVRPTVIFGRNQDMETEVNVPFCEEQGIEMYRRRSGGGCVYADLGNVMMSMVTRQQNVSVAFGRFLLMLTSLLRDLGLPATYTTHNDIMVGERKMSGNAFYHLPTGSIVHGTMLYDINFENMLGSLTPSRTKLERHGVQSVRQRVTTLREHLSISLEEFMEKVRAQLCDSAETLSTEEVKKIEVIEREYLNPDFIHRRPTH